MTSNEETCNTKVNDSNFKIVLCTREHSPGSCDDTDVRGKHLKRTLEVTKDTEKSVPVPIKKRRVDFSQSSNDDNSQERTQSFDFMSDCLLLKYPLLEFSLSKPPPPYLLTEHTFIPDQVILEKLSETLGISGQVAEKSLYWSGNSGYEEACEWLCNRDPLTWLTPLETEISMLKTELENRSQDVRDRLWSSDSGYVSVRDEEEIDLPEQEVSEYGLVIVVNGCMTIRNHVLLKLISSVTIGIISKVSSNYFGEYQLRQWEKCNQSIRVVQGETVRHLADLQLAANCLGLTTQQSDLLVLGIWGELEVLDLAVGRLPEYSSSS